MATVYEIFIAGKEGTYAGQAARAAFDEIDRLEGLFSRFDPSSEVRRIGRLGPGGSMRIGIETFEALRLSARLRKETSGAFDINFRAKRPVRRAGKSDGATTLSDPLRLEKLPDGFAVTRAPAEGRRKAEPVDLDLGAVGKGLALDAARDVLRDWGVGNALLHAGTSTALAVGPGPERKRTAVGWPVGLATGWPRIKAPKSLGLLDRALSGSGSEVKGAHIVDPRTGRPAARHAASWAAHPSAAWADALSTAFMIMSTEEVRAFCRRHPEAAALVIINPKTCKIFPAGAFSQDRRTPTRRSE